MIQIRKLAIGFFLNEDLAFSGSCPTLLKALAGDAWSKSGLGCGDVLPHRARLKFGIREVHLDQVANRYEAEKPTSLDHGHVAELMQRRF